MLGKRLLVLTSLLVVVGILITACQPEKVVETVVVTQVTEGETVEVVVTATPSAEEPEETIAEGPIPADGLVPCLPLPEMAFGGSGPGVAALARSRTADVSRVEPLVQPASGVAEGTVEAFTASSVRPGVDRQAGLVYRVGVFEDLTSTNFWSANGPDNTVWNAYMLPQRLTMYNLSDQRFDFVPLVAKEMPAPLTQEGDFWVVEVPIRDDITWSDGELFTAEDVAFTANAALKLGLISGNWSQWYDKNYLDHIEAVDDYTVKYYYHTKPGLARHQEGSLQAPILAEHFWAPLVDEATAPIDALPDDASEEEVFAAQAEAHDNLFAIEPEGEPLAGSYLFTKWEPGAFTEVGANPDYFQTGAIVTEYANGAYQESLVDTYDFTLYGEAEGDVKLQYQVGPHVGAAVYTIYSSQDVAILALRAGEIDMLLNPLGLQRGLLDQVEGDPNLEVLQNSVNGFRYMAFNHRRRPMNDCSFRQAVAILIDKEFVAGTILQDVAFPLYSFVPSANGAWYFDDVPKLGLRADGTSMSREERINMAVAILEQAGYSWENSQTPAWNTDNGEVDVGSRLIMPDGTPVPTIELWAPNAGYDPLRSTFAIWIERWLNEAGIPVVAHLAGFNTLIPRIFTEQDFDMYILGWSLDTFPAYMRDYWHSEQAVPDGNNAAGYENPEFDVLAESLMTCETLDDCRPICDQLQTMLATEVPYVLLFDTGIIEPYRSASIAYPYTEHLSGLQYSHQLPYQSLQNSVKIK
jgi:peptide/nickel transport system substrate-binding protein